MPKRSLILPAFMLVAMLGFALTGWSAGSRAIEYTAGARPGLVLSGTVKGLYPGAKTQLRVAVRNRFGVRVRVTRVTATGRDASKSCRKKNLAFGRYRGRLLVPAHRVRYVSLKVTMARTAPNGCKGAGFRLALRATVVRP